MRVLFPPIKEMEKAAFPIGPTSHFERVNVRFIQTKESRCFHPFHPLFRPRFLSCFDFIHKRFPLYLIALIISISRRDDCFWIVFMVVNAK